MNSNTYYYSNSNGDSLVTGSISETQSTYNEGVMFPDQPEGTVAELYTQTVEIDTLFDYETILRANFTDGNRIDEASITGLGLSLEGEAEPNYGFPEDFSDTLIINGETYTNVYSKLSVDQSSGLFVNVEKGLVAFITEKDTFNLLN